MLHTNKDYLNIPARQDCISVRMPGFRRAREGEKRFKTIKPKNEYQEKTNNQKTAGNLFTFYQL